MTFTPVIAKPDLTLRNVRLTLATGVVVDAIKISIKRTIRKHDRSSGGSGVDQTVLGRQQAQIMVEGWNTSNLSFGDITPGTQVTTLTLLDTEATPASILQSDFFTKFPVNTWYFGDTETTIEEKPSTWQTELIPNVVGVE